MVKIGIIGGSGLDDPKVLEDYREVKVKTPYGIPSSSLTCGNLHGIEVVILARHGKKHTLAPSNVNFRANISALKAQGCTHLLASTACGSLREEIEPGHLVFPDQFIDRTTRRISTFYDKDQVCHIAMEEPFCKKLRVLLEASSKELALNFHTDKTLITIEGPRFSTKAESHMFRTWGADVINMSTVPEAVLAREAGLCYQVIAMSTDYDCFMETQENVTWEQIVKVMKTNAENVLRLISRVIPRIEDKECACRAAIRSALVGEEEGEAR